MKRQNVLIIITLLSIAAYFISLQFVRKERLDQTPQAQKSSRPEGGGLPSDRQSHRPEGGGLPSNSQSHKPAGSGLPSDRQSHKPAGSGLPSDRQSHAELELRIQQLNDLLQAIIQANLAHRTVEQEKPQPDLIQKLQEVIAENETLEQELRQAKAGLELVRPAKQRFSEQEQNLSRQLKEKENAALSVSEELKRVKNTKAALERAITEAERIKDELKQTNTSLKAEISRTAGELKEARAKLSLSFQEKEQLRQSLEEFKQANQRAVKELSSLKNSIEQLDKEKRMLKDELQEELTQLRVQLELLNKTYTDLQNEHTAIQQALKQNEIDLGARADRILVSEEKLKIAEVQLADKQLKYTDLEKESALSREQNVAVQLEREDLKNQLQQAKLRLNELENQAAQILKLLKPAGEDRVTLHREESKRVEVELFPAKDLANSPEAGK